MNLKVQVVTFNLGENKKKHKDWMNELSNWTNIIQTDSDIICLCLQEDWNASKGYFGYAMYDWLLKKDNTFRMAKNIVKGPPDIFRSPFSVKIFVYYKVWQVTNIKDASICLKPVLWRCGKATVGISFVINNKLQFIAMSSHLPIKTQELSLGYSARVKAVKESLESVHNKLRDSRFSSFVSVWGGDMNFRKDTPIDEEGQNTPSDQLDHAISQGYFDKFKEHSNRTFPPTCKMEECKETHCPVCRKTSHKFFKKECYIRQSKGTQRIPSHCDRILYSNSTDLSISVDLYESYAEQPAIQTSDHNVVSAVFRIN